MLLAEEGNVSYKTMCSWRSTLADGSDTYLIASEPKRHICSFARDAGSNHRRRRGCGCFIHTAHHAALVYDVTSPNFTVGSALTRIAFRSGVHSWAKCQPGGAFWCDQLAPEDLVKALDGTCRVPASPRVVVAPRPDCGASFCAWRPRQMREMLAFRRKVLLAEQQGRMERILFPRSAAVDPRAFQSTLWNEVVTTYGSFANGIHAFIVPAANDRALSAATAAAAEAAAALGRRVPVLLLRGQRASQVIVAAS